HGFRYDTSGIGHANAWPEKIDGLWRFNLGLLRIQRSGRGTLSVGYNFFVGPLRAGSDFGPLQMGRANTLRSLSQDFKENLPRKSSAAPYRPPFHELRRRRL